MNLLPLAMFFLGLLFSLMTVLLIIRIVLTWYPPINLQRFPVNLVIITTEPLLIPMRKLIPPLGGVDISPILWVALITLLRELLLGQQGLMTMATRLQ